MTSIKSEGRDLLRCITRGADMKIFSIIDMTSYMEMGIMCSDNCIGLVTVTDMDMVMYDSLTPEGIASLKFLCSRVGKPASLESYAEAYPDVVKATVGKEIDLNSYLSMYTIEKLVETSSIIRKELLENADRMLKEHMNCLSYWMIDNTVSSSGVYLNDAYPDEPPRIFYGCLTPEEANRVTTLASAKYTHTDLEASAYEGVVAYFKLNGLNCLYSMYRENKMGLVDKHVFYRLEDYREYLSGTGRNFHAYYFKSLRKTLASVGYSLENRGYLTPEPLSLSEKMRIYRAV